MTAPTTAGGAVLPVLMSAFRTTETRGDPDPAKRRYHMVFTFTTIEAMHAADDEWMALTAPAPAQAEIDALRAENERLTRERDHALMAASCEATAGDEARDALKAALNPPAHTPPTGVFVQAAQDDQARPIRMERARGDTVAEMRKNLSPELWGHGDAVICWVNEGDYICAAFAATKETP